MHNTVTVVNNTDWYLNLLIQYILSVFTIHTKKMLTIKIMDVN